MSYWGSIVEDIAGSFFNLEDVEYGYWPDEFEAHKEELKGHYEDLLIDYAGKLEEYIETFLDAVKYEVESFLKDYYRDFVGKDVDRYDRAYDDIARLGDYLAWEEGFNAMGGVPEYNELDHDLKEFFESVEADAEVKIDYSERETFEKMLLEASQNAGQKEWKNVEESASYFRDELKTDLQSALDDDEEDEY